jgi:threonine/homoserine/homoserine lactone efflux protein
MPVDLSALSSQHWLSGLLIGLVAAAPIGPINILVIQRSLQQGRRSALWLGAGAAMGDAVFAAGAALGLGAIHQLFDAHHAALRIGGGLFMIVFGLFLWRQAPHLNAPGQRLPPTSHVTLVVLVMTLTNPATLLWFVAAFAMFRFESVGPENTSTLAHAVFLVLGVFCGSMLWWLGLSSLAVKLRARFMDSHLRWMNHGCAILLTGLGAYAIATAH